MACESLRATPIAPERLMDGPPTLNYERNHVSRFAPRLLFARLGKQFVQVKRRGEHHDTIAFSGPL